MDQIMIAHNGKNEKTDYEYEVVVYDPKHRKKAFSYAKELRDKGIKTELILKNKNIEIDEYRKMKLNDGASKVTYITDDGTVVL